MYWDSSAAPLKLHFVNDKKDVTYQSSMHAQIKLEEKQDKTKTVVVN